MTTSEPAAAAVAANVRRLREGRRYTLRSLAQALTEAGWPLSADSLNKIEKGTRRVDVDDLMALAVVLGVHPAALLLPFTATDDMEITGHGAVPADTAWRWMEGRRPLDVPDGDDGSAHVQFEQHAHPWGLRRYWITTEPGKEQFARDHPERDDDGGT